MKQMRSSSNTFLITWPQVSNLWLSNLLIPNELFVGADADIKKLDDDVKKEEATLKTLEAALSDFQGRFSAQEKIVNDKKRRRAELDNKNDEFRSKIAKAIGVTI